MKTAYQSTMVIVLEFFVLFCLTVSVPYIVYYDVIILKNGASEHSLTEVLQQFAILVSACLFYWDGYSCPRSRGFLVLIGSFFFCMFIREGDIYFDKIAHGFWVYPAATVALISIAYAFKNSRHMPEAIHNYLHSRAYYFILVGLIIILAFSRVFGSGHLLWEEIMGSHYDAIYKATIQEGLELFGYMFVLYGSFFSLKDLRHDHDCTY